MNVFVSVNHLFERPRFTLAHSALERRLEVVATAHLAEHTQAYGDTAVSWMFTQAFVVAASFAESRPLQRLA
jgi:acyl-CoA hydrolase